MKELENENLKKYTTLHIGGNGKHVYFPQTEEEICSLLEKKPLIIGQGSNMLINDKMEIEHVMILKEFKAIKKKGNILICDSGTKLMDVCLFAYQHSLTGLEFAYGIPGSVGGAIIMNAGAYGGEIKDVVKKVKTNLKEYTNEECEFHYRHSYFSDSNECVLKVELELKTGNKEVIHARMKELIDKRNEKQPLDQHSAGSTFKRGKDFYASQLINECELKGFHVNDAAVSTKHAGFLINEKNASFEDFMALVCQVQKIVFEKTQKQLECEIKIIGGKDDLCK